jgi:flagellar hook assembly protein FlgD
LGQIVRTLITGQRWAGKHTIFWDGCNDLGETLANGIYLIRVVSGARKETCKVTMLHGK